MKNLLLTSPKGGVQAKKLRKLASQAGFRVETQALESLKKITTVPDITLIDVDDPKTLAKLVRDAVQIQSQAPARSRVLFSVNTGSRGRGTAEDQVEIVSALNRQLKAFPNPGLVDVTFAQPADQMAALLNYIGNKIDLTRENSGKSSPRPGPLDRMKEIVDATSDLRVENGKLSAEGVAKAFGVTISDLAKWSGKSRQTVSKTPDADSLQNKLGFFERVARLRTVISKNDFLKWLRMRNQELDGKQPLELLAKGEGQVVADLVDDMLTGAPA